MSAFKGTPGPWALQMAEDCPGRQLDEMVKWVVTANAHDMWVSTGPTWDAEHDAEALANAHLIAAAPELLEALRRLNSATRRYMEERPQSDADWASDEPSVLSIVDAAIAKATGEQT